MFQALIQIAQCNLEIEYIYLKPEKTDISLNAWDLQRIDYYDIKICKTHKIPYSISQ